MIASRLRPRATVWLIIALPWVALGCVRVNDAGNGGGGADSVTDGGDSDAGPSCIVGGKRYAPGEAVPSIDGCNDCTCTAIGVGCTKKACIGTQCGGITAAQCELNEFCKYAVTDQCGANDASGMCSKKPAACTDTQDPVCGCDSKTYSDACHAALAGVSVAATGACGSSSSTTQCSATQPCVQPPCACIDNNNDGKCDNHCPSYECRSGKCVDAAQTVCGGFGGSTCSSDEYCNYTLDAVCGAADATGLCAPKPSSCSDFGAVCGCDGRDYTSSCQAAMAGTAVSKLGTCK